MDQFVTTYRKDYLWPYIRSFGKRLIESVPPSTGFENKCVCKCYPPPEVDRRQHAVPDFDTQAQNWSRISPMGALLDPKLYPVKVGKAPESDTMRLDQPNTFLRKLREKYPFLYETLQTAPDLDVISKVMRDRLRTTYQVDYCKMDEYPPDDLLRASGMGLGPCPEAVKLPGDMYRPVQKTIAFRPALVSKMQQIKKSKCEGEDTGTGVWTFNKTEYQDTVSKLGALIEKDKLHYHHPRKL